MAETQTDRVQADPGSDRGLPGNILIWILIVSEFLVFVAALAGFAGARILAPDVFRAGVSHLSPLAGSVNTAILLTSGLCAALALEASDSGRKRLASRWLAAAALIGAGFVVVKILEYAAKIRLGLTIDTDNFFTLYYLITGFHLAHVIFGVLLFLLVAVWPSRDNVRSVTMFWHLVDLIWVMVFPVIYLTGNS